MGTLAKGWILMLLLCLAFSELPPESDASNNHLEIYKRLFAVKRKEQIKTAEQIMRVDNYEKQYKTIKFLMDTIFPVLQQSLAEVAAMKYEPDDPFPDDQEKRETIGKIYENVAFLGDVLLRIPDMTKKIYKENKKEWQSVLEESLQFCNASMKVFSGHQSTHLHLMAQEIGILPEDPDYVNPFRAPKPAQVERPSKGKTKQRKTKQKSGPKLRGSKMTNRIEL